MGGIDLEKLYRATLRVYKRNHKFSALCFPVFLDALFPLFYCFPCCSFSPCSTVSLVVLFPPCSPCSTVSLVVLFPLVPLVLLFPLLFFFPLFYCFPCCFFSPLFPLFYCFPVFLRYASNLPFSLIDGSKFCFFTQGSGNGSCTPPISVLKSSISPTSGTVATLLVWRTCLVRHCSMWTNHLLNEQRVKAYVFLKNKPLELQVQIHTRTLL